MWLLRVFLRHQSMQLRCYPQTFGQWEGARQGDAASPGFLALNQKKLEWIAGQLWDEWDVMGKRSGLRDHCSSKAPSSSRTEAALPGLARLAQVRLYPRRKCGRSPG